MTRFPISTRRSDRLPQLDGAVNIMMVSDMHIAAPPDDPQYQSDKAATDLNNMVGRGVIDAWVMGGDCVSRANEAEYANFHAWMETINFGGKPIAMVPGNHDLIGSGFDGGVPDVQTPDQFVTRMSRYGVTGRNYVVDLEDNVRILCLFPMDNTLTGVVKSFRLTLDTAALQWCDDRLSETDRRCVIVFHAPLYGTVGTPETFYTSYSPYRSANSQDSYKVEDMLSKHSNIIAWVSGHTHTPPFIVDNVKTVDYGAGPFAAVSIGSPLTQPGNTAPVIVSSLLSVYPHKVEVRYRDHGAGQWLDPVRTVSL